MKWFTSIVDPPETATLATDEIEQKPTVGKPWHRRDVPLPCDHRVVDGAVAAGFLAAVRDALRIFGREPKRSLATCETLEASRG